MSRISLAALAVVIAASGVLLVLALAQAGPFSADPPSNPASATGQAACRDGRAPVPRVDRVDRAALEALLRRQVELGPRPAGSPASRRLAGELRRLLPNGRFEPVAGGLRNVVGELPGRDPARTVIVGAHYDTKDLPGFVGANDGAGGTAAVVAIARALERLPRRGPTVRFVLFDGEESPRGTPDREFAEHGLRGSRAAAARTSPDETQAVVVLDFIADRDLSIPRERNSDPALWERLRAAAARVGVGCVFPDDAQPAVTDDHVPFLERGIPAIDLIDFDFACFHERCDDLSAVSGANADAVAEAVTELVASL